MTSLVSICAFSIEPCARLCREDCKRQENIPDGHRHTDDRSRSFCLLSDERTSTFLLLEQYVLSFEEFVASEESVCSLECKEEDDMPDDLCGSGSRQAGSPPPYVSGMILLTISLPSSCKASPHHTSDFPNEAIPYQ